MADSSPSDLNQLRRENARWIGLLVQRSRSLRRSSSPCGIGRSWRILSGPCQVRSMAACSCTLRRFWAAIGRQAVLSAHDHIT